MPAAGAGATLEIVVDRGRRASMASPLSHAPRHAAASPGPAPSAECALQSAAVSKGALGHGPLMTSSGHGLAASSHLATPPGSRTSPGGRWSKVFDAFWPVDDGDKFAIGFSAHISSSDRLRIPNPARTMQRPATESVCGVLLESLVRHILGLIK